MDLYGKYSKGFQYTLMGYDLETTTSLHALGQTRIPSLLLSQAFNGLFFSLKLYLSVFELKNISLIFCF
jgi:Leucine-rich repeat (LRR) protein